MGVSSAHTFQMRWQHPRILWRHSRGHPIGTNHRHFQERDLERNARRLMPWIYRDSRENELDLPTRASHLAESSELFQTPLPHSLPVRGAGSNLPGSTSVRGGQIWTHSDENTICRLAQNLPLLQP